MKEAGRKNEYKASELQAIDVAKNYDGLAVALPSIPKDRQLVCVFDKWGTNDGTEQMFICERIEDINHLLQRYNGGWALGISFVTVPNEHFKLEEEMSSEELVTLMKSSASKEE